MLTKQDLNATGKIIDVKLDEKFVIFAAKFDKKLEQKFKPVYEFIEFAKPALESLLEES